MTKAEIQALVDGMACAACFNDRQLRMALLSMLAGFIESNGSILAVGAFPASLFILVGQSLALGPVGPSAVHTSSDHDDEILSYTLGDPAPTRLTYISDQSRVGPGEAFAREMWGAGVTNVCLFKSAFGGVPISHFLPESQRLAPLKEGKPVLWPAWIDEPLAVAEYLNTQGFHVVIRGIIMFHGRADLTEGTVSVYDEQLERLVQVARERLGGNYRWLQIISPTWSGSAQNLSLQAKQRAVANETISMEFVESDNAMGIPLVIPDGVHPDGESSERIGQAAFQKWSEAFGL